MVGEEVITLPLQNSQTWMLVRLRKFPSELCGKGLGEREKLKKVMPSLAMKAW